MTITRERQPDFAGRQTDWRGDTRADKRSDARLCGADRKNAGRGGKNDLTGAIVPCLFLRWYDIL